LNEPGGTAFGSRVPGVEAGGKTGTVQVIGRETTVKAGANKRKLGDHGWFAGFAPVDNPQMVVAVFVENGGHGNLSAAPLAKLLFEKRFGKPEAVPAPPQQRAQRAASDFVPVAGRGAGRSR
jgi:penicillin-binding protein 2